MLNCRVKPDEKQFCLKSGPLKAPDYYKELATVKKSLLNGWIVACALFLSAWCHSEPIVRVPLTIRRANTNATVSWPYPSRGFELQVSTNLSAPNWQPATGTSVSNNGGWEFTAPVNPPGRYFRLKNHVEHFGFWPGSIATLGSMTEQAGYVTFTDLQGGFSTNAANLAIALGMKILVGPPNFFDVNAVNQIKPYTNNILAFFMMDEPDCAAGGDTNKLNGFLSNIELQIAKARTNYPGSKSMITLGCAFWGYSNFRLPTNLDYIALESYGPSGDPAATKAEWLSKISHLKSYMNSSQRIFLMPGAAEGYGTESQLIQKANDIYNYAQTDPLIIGVFPFDWYSDNYDCASVGQFCGNGVPATNYSIPVIGGRSARDLPNLRARYIQIGQSIINGPFLDVGGGAPSIEFLGGSSLPSSPWISTHGGGTSGTTLVVNFFDQALGATNQALRINSDSNANEWFVGPFLLDEWAVGARFRLVAFSPVGKENLLCLTTHSTPLSPAPSITLVDGRYKLWSYVNSNTEIMDLGPVAPNAWHIAYLYARKDGKVKLWWDGNLVFDGTAPLVNPFNAYAEWGSGSWQYDATTIVDFDWVAYGNNF